MHKLSNDLRRRIIEAVEYPFIDKRTDKSLLIALHGEVFSSDLCKTCENEQIRAYIELYRLIKPKGQTMKNPPSKNYRFHPLHEDAEVALSGVRGFVTADNLTDEVAKRLLKSHPELVVTVEDYQSISKKIEQDSKVDYSAKTVKELKAILDDAGVDYTDAKLKADFVELAQSIG